MTTDHTLPLASEPPVGVTVPWQTIASIPADRLDGRDVLLWAGFLLVGSWCDAWCDAVGRPIRGITHWADVEGPGDATCRDR